MKHTPTPWLREGTLIYALMHDGWRKGKEQFRNRFYFSVQRDRECSEEEALANAEFIHRAVNAHDALVEALEALTELAFGEQESEEDIDRAWGAGKCASAIARKARAALALAKEPEE